MRPVVHFVFYGNKFVNISEPARGYIQVSKTTRVRFVLVMSTIMLLRILNSFLHVHVSDHGQLLLIACT